jgi:outer membrane protein assembly complex protein YaeT
LSQAAALCVAGALIVATAGAARADVGDYLGKPVASVRAVAEGQPLVDSKVLDLIETRTGKPLSMQDVRRSVTHLISLGRFEDVQVDAVAVPDGVNLVYDVVPVHPVEQISFTGAVGQPGVDPGRLKRALTERYGSAPSAARARDLALLIEDELRTRGYLHPTVSHQVRQHHTPHHAELVFAVEPGSRTHVGRVTVTGTPGMPEAQLLARLRISSGMPYEPEVLNRRLEEFRESRRTAGYVQATAAILPAFESDDRIVNLAVVVDQGARVRVLFKGDPLPRDQQTELVPIAEEGSVDEDLLEDSSGRIQDYFRTAGYRDASVTHVREEAKGELIVTFTITRGPEYRLASISVTGSTFIAASEIEARLGLRVGRPFSEIELERELSAIEGLYRQEGFSAAEAEFDVDVTPSPAGAAIPVAVRVRIVENVRTVVRSVRLEGNSAISEPDLRDGLGLQIGRPFFVTQMAVDRDTIQLRYANLGFQNAVVTGNPGISADGSQADVVFTVREGSQVFVDHILIAGNLRTRAATIERELQIRPGEPLGVTSVLESQRRLAELGLFRRTRITQVGHGDETRRDVLVSVEESPVTTIGYGGGLEVGQRVTRTESEGAAVSQLDFAPRAFFEIGRRNLFDKNRSINLFTRVSLRSIEDATIDLTDIPEDRRALRLSEYRVLGTYREPRVLGTTADAFLTATVEQQSRSSFDFARQAFNAVVGRRLSPRVSMSGTYQIQRTRLFNERINPADRLLIDRLFPQLRLSSVSVSAVESTRDDAVEPREGHYLSANGELASEALGSEVGFFKSFLTAQLFRTLPRTAGTVFAASVRVGLATGFARTVTVTDESGEPVLDPDGEPHTEVVKDLPASERFFAGGDTTVRGFALDQLGTPETLDQDGFALGGNALLILNAELRIPVRGSIGVVGFVDAGNVFSRTTEIDLGELRSAAGFGLRYRSPVGPIRIDLGFKLGRREVVPGVLETPTALHISLGQAF